MFNLFEFSDIIFGNTIQDLLYASLAFFWIIITRYVLKLLIDKKLSSFVKKSKSQIDDIILAAVNKFLSFWFFIFWLYLAKWFIILSQDIDKIVNKTLEILLVLAITYISQSISSKIVNAYFDTKNDIKWRSVSSILKNIVSIIIWLIWITFALSLLWYNISKLAAWIWISGIAVALAIQPTLAWIFAWFSIFADKPFRVWDRVIIKWYEWEIKEIWLRSTRMITIKWNEVVFPNTELIKLEIENISQREAIRQDLNIWIVYNTDSKKVNKWIDIIKNILTWKNWIKQNDIRVVFKTFWDSALIIWVTYFIESNIEILDQLKIISEVNLEIKNRFEKEKIEFAYPTQTLFLKK